MTSDKAQEWLDAVEEKKMRDWLDSFKPPWSGTGECPGSCMNRVPYLATAYGLRAVCEDEGRMFTRIRGEGPVWTEEIYSPMGDNVS